MKIFKVCFQGKKSLNLIFMLMEFLERYDLTRSFKKTKFYVLVLDFLLKFVSIFYFLFVPSC